MSLVERASGQITAAREADTARSDLADRAREESPSASLPAIRAPVLHKGRAPLAVQCCRGAQLLILMASIAGSRGAISDGGYPPVTTETINRRPERFSVSQPPCTRPSYSAA